MNLNTIEQELAKKFKGMSYYEYVEFIHKLDRIYAKQHKKSMSVDKEGNVWINVAESLRWK